LAAQGFHFLHQRLDFLLQFVQPGVARPGTRWQWDDVAEPRLWCNREPRRTRHRLDSELDPFLHVARQSLDLAQYVGTGCQFDGARFAVRVADHEDDFLLALADPSAAAPFELSQPLLGLAKHRFGLLELRASLLDNGLSVL